MTTAPPYPIELGDAAGVRPYLLRCPLCRTAFADDGLQLDCPRPHGPALLRTEYTTGAFAPAAGEGLFRYRSWLPVARQVPGAAGSATYRAERLGRALGLDQLWVAFSGYWPERGARLTTGTFKELEAYAVLGRLPERPPVLVIASAGNTAAAFIRACSREEVPCVVVVPEGALAGLASADPVAPWVRLVAVAGDYTDAIELADAIAARPGFQAEGGTRNVARRDGLGTALLTAAETIGRLPDHYVQAVGSGAGAIAAHETSARLLAAGFPAAAGGTGPRLMLCQNLPFAPMYRAWQAGLAALSVGSGPAERAAVAEAAAPELTTRKPPYAVRGGVHDVLTESGGELLAAGNTETAAARELFLATEGIDIEPAAGVALACLRQAVADGRIDREAVVLLHVTGGGRARYAAEHRLHPARPDLRVTAGQQNAADLVASTFDTSSPRFARSGS